MAESFARMKWRWLDRAMHDSRLSPRARCVAYEVGRHINAVTGEAWPSQETMRRNLGFKDVSQVKRAVAELHKAGHLAVSRDPVSRSNTYVPRFEAALHIVPLTSPGERGGKCAPTPEVRDGGKCAPIGGGTGAPTWGQNPEIDGGIGAPVSSKDNTQTETRPVSVVAVPRVDAQWQSIKNNLAKLLTPTVAAAWFEGVTIEQSTEIELTLSVQNRFTLKWIGDHFANAVLSAVFSACPSIVTVTLVARDDLRTSGGLPPGVTLVARDYAKRPAQGGAA